MKKNLKIESKNLKKDFHTLTAKFCKLDLIANL